MAGCIQPWKMEIYHLSEIKPSSCVVSLDITSCDFFQQLNWLKYLLQTFITPNLQSEVSTSATWPLNQTLFSPDVEHLSFLIKRTGVSTVEKHTLLKVTCSGMENWNFALSSS